VLLRRWRAPGEGLERREFSPGIPEVISKTKNTKDTALLCKKFLFIELYDIDKTNS
jgi:hypothetical protein